ncbi:MAG TPA: DUF1361 domain-containing protein [Verrucomicrobiae bacterium]
MNLQNLQTKPGTGFPVVCLLISSAIATGLLATRIFFTHRFQHLYLVWNLFLAWLPLGLAIVLAHWFRQGRNRAWRFYAAAFAWLIFFPNAPYIFTDLVHLTHRPGGLFWVDMVLILLFSLNGLFAGFLSLHLIHWISSSLYGRIAGWLCVAVATGLSGLGIYIGRFLRWNSWDILVNPINLAADLMGWLAHPISYPAPLVYSALFALFLFLAYLMLHALTHLNPIHSAALKTGTGSAASSWEHNAS